MRASICVGFIIVSYFSSLQTTTGLEHKMTQSEGGKENRLWPFPVYFDCFGREEGYYADYYRGCKVFYYCKPDGTIMPFVCPEDYIFDDFSKVCGSPDKVYCPPYEP